jgi:hypothetical protein
MLNKISAADARKKFANIGEALAAIVSMEDLKLLQEIEEQMDIEDAWKARNEPGESISWEKLREELDL